MPHLHVALSAPFPMEDVVAELTFADGTQRTCVLREGRFAADFAQPVTWLRLTDDKAPAGEAELRIAAPHADGQKFAGQVVAEIEELFERGIKIPASGDLSLFLIWGIHCHRAETGPTLVQKANGEAASDDTRFLSSEHEKCAERIGFDATWMDPLVVKKVPASFNYETPLPIGNRTATFGQIIALAGDFYAYLDRAARENNGSAWPEAPGWIQLLAADYREPPLAEDDNATIADILKTFDRELEQLMSGKTVGAISELLADGVTTKFPVRRYLALAAMNYCHFGAQPADGTINDDTNKALHLYRYYHRRALAQAEVAGMSMADAATKEQRFKDALVVDAFGCHFLTDLFASGHLRVPRQALGEKFGAMRGGNGMAHPMHDEDNRLGLWCTTRIAQNPRVVWRAYGDGKLLKPESVPHLWMVQEAVRRSSAEVYARYQGVSDTPEADTAEALLPVALAAGLAPLASDVLPANKGKPAREPANHFPLFTMVTSPSSGRKYIARRVNDKDPHQNLYFEQDGDKAKQFALPGTGTAASGAPHGG